MDTISSTSPRPSTTTSNASSRLRGFALISVLISLMLTLLLEALDQTIVGTALPRIIGELQGFDRYTWVVTAYLLASTAMIPIIGKLSDQFGRKWFFIVGVITFLVGSVLSGLSQTMDQLIIFRALQGLGAGTGIALVFTVVGDIFPPAERARWQGIFSGVYGFSSVVGPTAGGWLTDHGPLLGNLVTDTTRWRWVFYINLPLGLIALIALLAYLPTNISIRSSRYTGWAALRRIDFLGAVLSSGATICLLLGLTWGSDQTYNWNSPQVIGVLIAAGVLLIVFFIAERFATEPLLPLDLFRNQVFSAGTGLAMMQGSVLLPLIIYLPLYLQVVLGQTATDSGAVITPLTVSIVIGASMSGFVIAMLKRYQMITILSALLLGFGMFLMTQMTATTSLLVAGRNMVIVGIGLGAFFSVSTLAVQNALPRTRLGIGTGAVRYLQALGQTLGLAIVGTVVNSVIASNLATRLTSKEVQQLTPQGIKFATDPQILVDATYRDTVVKTAVNFAKTQTVPKAVAQAVQQAQVPPGPHYKATVDAISQQVSAQVSAQVTVQVTHLLQQVFEALKQSLSVAIQHGFVTVLVFCGGVLLSALFLKDVPLKSRADVEQHEHSKPNI
ncbi:MAG TPA: MDR family MFS transporter [Ktedonobacteraceae bacterium]